MSVILHCTFCPEQGFCSISLVLDFDNLFILFLLVCGYGLWELFVKNGFLLVVIAVVYLQLWQKNKLVYVQHARAVI
jgi:hypothetical protein